MTERGQPESEPTSTRHIAVCLLVCAVLTALYHFSPWESLGAAAEQPEEQANGALVPSQTTAGPALLKTESAKAAPGRGLVRPQAGSLSQSIDVVPRLDVEPVETPGAVLMDARQAAGASTTPTPAGSAPAQRGSRSPVTSAQPQAPVNALNTSEPLHFDAPAVTQVSPSRGGRPAGAIPPGEASSRFPESAVLKLPLSAGRSVFEGRWQGSFDGEAKGRLVVEIDASGAFKAEALLWPSPTPYQAAGRVLPNGALVLESTAIPGRINLQGFLDDTLDHGEGAWRLAPGQLTGAWRLDRTR